MTYVPTTDERRSLGVTAIATRASADLEMSIFDCRAVIAWMLHEIMPPGMTVKDLQCAASYPDEYPHTVTEALTHLLSILEPGEKGGA
jgi:hypothetical protein